MGFRCPIGEYARKGCVDALKRNLEVEPFVARWVVQMEEKIHELGMVENTYCLEVLLEKKCVVVDLC